MSTQQFTRLIGNVLFESQEFWTADNTDKLFKFLADDELVVNGDEGDEYLVKVIKLDPRIERTYPCPVCDRVEVFNKYDMCYRCNDDYDEYVESLEPRND